jgi:hypothetical protein
VPLTRVVSAPPSPAVIVLALALLVPAVNQAGYTSGGRALLVALAGVALAVVVVIDDRGVHASLRSKPVLALALLAGLSVISVSWTVIRPLDSLLSGLVVAGYCALTISAAALARNRGVGVLTGMIAVVAVVEAALGVGSAALRELPYAERIGGTWRAGGSFEYSSALALLEVAALPALLSAMARARAPLAAAAASAAVLSAGVIVLAQSRTELALAILIAAIALTWPRPTLGASRGVATAAVALVAVGAVSIREIVGGYVRPHDVGGGIGRIGWVAVAVAAAAACWPAVRPYAQRLRFRATRGIRVAMTCTAIALSVAGLFMATATERGRGVEPRGGLAHGRSEQWRAAWSSFLDRPAIGAGADAYVTASAPHQRRALVRYAHDLPLESAAELGAAGLLVVVGLYVAVGVALWRVRRAPSAWLVAPGVAAFMLANLVDWEWHLPLSGVVWALGLGAVIALGDTARGPGARGPARRTQHRSN